MQNELILLITLLVLAFLPLSADASKSNDDGCRKTVNSSIRQNISNLRQLDSMASELTRDPQQNKFRRLFLARKLGDDLYVEWLDENDESVIYKIAEQIGGLIAVKIPFEQESTDLEITADIMQTARIISFEEVTAKLDLKKRGLKPGVTFRFIIDDRLPFIPTFAKTPDNRRFVFLTLSEIDFKKRTMLIARDDQTEIWPLTYTLLRNMQAMEPYSSTPSFQPAPSIDQNWWLKATPALLAPLDYIDTLKKLYQQTYPQDPNAEQIFAAFKMTSPREARAFWIRVNRDFQNLALPINDPAYPLAHMINITINNAYDELYKLKQK